MCGRFSQSQSTQKYAKAVAPDWQPESLSFQPTWNLAPGRQAQVFTMTQEGFQASLMHWGLLPAWADPKSQKPINARVETAATKPYFRKAWKSGRCLIPADGWYEWLTSLKSKQPFFLYQADHEPLLMAGLCEMNPHLGMTTFTILTTEADGDLRQVHDRKPVVLSNEMAREWIKPNLGAEALNQIANAPLSAAHFAWHAVSTQVNNARNDGSNLVDQIK